jgi:8-oxo-dGTP diphosphatase
VRTLTDSKESGFSDELFEADDSLLDSDVRFQSELIRSIVQWRFEMSTASIRHATSRHAPHGEVQRATPVTPQRREILKVGLAVTDRGQLLVVRKKGTTSYILPGGKPENGEDDLQTLAREIEEELGCRLDPRTIAFLGCFSDSAADMHDTKVTVRLYAAELVGNPSPRSEIESVKWHCPSVDSDGSLAPSLQNQIVPFLCAQGRLSGKP